ncbi:hypothetical protein GARC_2161 [Paraglaciecola arctica BSs20135]|uniref:Uncharacterized protein n=1 Tax=Paraglaciecola arctica BSs20135 TaxID=493475 RepID=K6YR50_9ALTE|nr:hypothetical protein GARC_2161 [Paraglaciecola arctica BSs20135]
MNWQLKHQLTSVSVPTQIMPSLYRKMVTHLSDLIPAVEPSDQ